MHASLVGLGNGKQHANFKLLAMLVSKQHTPSQRCHRGSLKPFLTHLPRRRPSAWSWFSRFLWQMHMHRAPRTSTRGNAHSAMPPYSVIRPQEEKRSMVRTAGSSVSREPRCEGERKPTTYVKAVRMFRTCSFQPWLSWQKCTQSWGPQ